jgi:hypothetical protein
MKNIQSTVEGTWIELVHVELTETEKAVLMSNDKQAKQNLAQELKSKREKSLSQQDSNIAQTIYLQHKPTLKIRDIYQLISVNMTLDGETGTGIINCRVNGEHKQIRF